LPPQNTNPATTLSWSADCKTVALGYAEGEVFLVDIETNFVRGGTGGFSHLSLPDTHARKAAFHGGKVSVGSTKAVTPPSSSSSSLLPSWWGHTSAIVSLAWGTQLGPEEEEEGEKALDNAGDAGRSDSRATAREGFALRELQASTASHYDGAIDQMLPNPKAAASTNLSGGGGGVAFGGAKAHQFGGRSGGLSRQTAGGGNGEVDYRGGGEGDAFGHSTSLLPDNSNLDNIGGAGGTGRVRRRLVVLVAADRGGTVSVSVGGWFPIMLFDLGRVLVPAVRPLHLNHDPSCRGDNKAEEGAALPQVLRMTCESSLESLFLWVATTTPHASTASSMSPPASSSITTTTAITPSTTTATTTATTTTTMTQLVQLNTEMLWARRHEIGAIAHKV
jgi:hypothetical protein